MPFTLRATVVESGAEVAAVLEQSSRLWRMDERATGSARCLPVELPPNGAAAELRAATTSAPPAPPR